MMIMVTTISYIGCARGDHGPGAAGPFKFIDQPELTRAGTPSGTSGIRPKGKIRIRYSLEFDARNRLPVPKTLLLVDRWTVGYI